MPYTALYRRLRPQSFNDVVGQQHITKILMNQLNTGRVAHAYLFCGTRGTGKTTTARVFARAVNCGGLNNGEPCNTCEICESVNSNRSLDVVEIDAASNNSVDNIRDLREEVKYPPSLGQYKVYIIDEVHMLSTGAFNALLKTLEEPPEHVIFILATTDPQKIPPTIHSRCQRFDFKRITTIDIFNAIRGYINSPDSYDRIDIDDKALMYISSLADGSMRDALSILEQCSAFYISSRISLENVQEIIGAVDKSVFYDLTDALISFDTNRCMEVISDIVINGRDIGQFVNELIIHFRNLLLIREISEGSKAIDFSLDNAERLTAQSAAIDPAVLIKYVSSFSQLASQLRYASNERIILEIACITLCNPIEINTESPGAPALSESYIKSLEQRINKLSDMLDTKNKSITQPTSVPNESKPVAPLAAQTYDDHTANIPQSQNNKHALQNEQKANHKDIQSVISNWKAFASEFDMPLKIFLQKAQPVYLEGDILQLITDESSIRSLKMHEEKISKRLTEKYKSSFIINFIDKGKHNEGKNNSHRAADRDEFKTSDFTDKINMDIIFEN